MQFELVAVALAFLLFAWTAVARSSRKAKAALRPPPGPRPWPLLGNLFQLSASPHKSLFRLARVHGPVMNLRFGFMRAVVVSSSAAAREVLRDHDAAFAGRAMCEAMRLSSGHDGSIITADPGPRWRILRRLCATGFFGAQQLNAMQGVRAECAAALVQCIDEEGGNGTRVVDLGRLLFLTAFGHTGRLMLSKDLAESNCKAGAEFLGHAKRIMELVGQPNISDLFPMFRRIDLQGIRREMEYHVGQTLRIVHDLVKERVERLTAEERQLSERRHKDLLDVLLDFGGDGLDEGSKFKLEIIPKIIVEMFMAGTDTTAATMEWAMAELLRHPAAMGKVQAELREAMSYDKQRPLMETDLMNLPYLKAVINETLRLHPPLPFLVPHKTLEPCTLLGYDISAGTQVLVNVWSIGRDPNTWEEPNSFKPERFMEGSQLDYKGQHFEFIPFGSGRRMCPGVPLASRLVPLILGSLLCHFDWSLGGEGKLDMSESMGITLRKAAPLQVLAVRVM